MSTCTEALKAPFPWFGGKRRVADRVWRALGDVDNYVEPFAGSLAVLLARPENHKRRAETVNDADGYLANFWRALAADPEAVAAWCDWPVNEIDKIARELWLVNEGADRIAKLEGDPDYYDVKVAGWWVHGINMYIAGGFCDGKGPWRTDGERCYDVRQLPHLGDAGRGVKRGLPHLVNAGRGVNRKRPHLSNAGRGVNRKRPHLGNTGLGVNRKRPHLGSRGADKPGSGASLDWEGRSDLLAYFDALAARLRRVRVCCGDWSRVVTNGALAYGDSVGVFLDPPYLGDVRCKDLYRVENYEIANEVREWAAQHTDNKRLRIIVAGYTDEPPMEGWRCETYTANAAYQTRGAAERNKAGEATGNMANRHKECLWYSPACLNDERMLF